MSSFVKPGSVPGFYSGTKSGDDEFRRLARQVEDMADSVRRMANATHEFALVIKSIQVRLDYLEERMRGMPGEEEEEE